jgi:hypothetical protein
MNTLIKNIGIVLFATVVITACSKNDDPINDASNVAVTAQSNFTLNNRVLAAFVIDSSSLPGITLPANYNRFRRLLTYDTLPAANKPVVYNVGDVIRVLGYVRGDANALSRRNINLRFFQPNPATFNTPTGLSTIQRAEDSVRNYAPVSPASTFLDTYSLPTGIAASTTAPFTVTPAATQTINGLTYTTFLVQVDYTIPASMSGRLVSINFNVANSLRNDIGNVNWIYAFRVR